MFFHPLTCHFLVFPEDMTSDFGSNIPALTNTENTNSYCVSRPSSASSLFSLFTVSPLFSLSVSLYCWWKAAETTWLSCWFETRQETGRKRYKLAMQRTV